MGGLPSRESASVQMNVHERDTARLPYYRSVRVRSDRPFHLGADAAESRATYRSEVDGLRAIAVMSVIFCHAGVSGFSGGFLGVDIFFVISGFLISGLILGSLDAGHFSVRDFYERRIRRILPAVFLVTGLCLIPGWFFMSADAYENLGESVVATTLSANNILLTVTTSYWEMESAFKPLLHTWSLGVEEQYYLFAPFVMLLAFRYSKRHPAWAIGLISLLSFVACLWMLPRYPAANFYLLPTRAWELGIGGLAAFYVRTRESAPSSSKLATAGLAATMASVMLVPSETLTPSPIVLVPVVGTALVLVYCRAGFTHAVLVLPPMRWIGLISYSAYLWHQPIFAFLRVISPTQPATWEYAALISVTLGLSWLSWRYVEKPFRNRKKMSFRTAVAILLPAAVCLVVAGGAIYKLGGIPSRLPLPVGAEAPGTYKSFNDENLKYKLDAFPPTAKKKLLVLGNSQGRDFINAMKAANKFPDYSIVYRDDFNLCDLDHAAEKYKKLVDEATLIVDVYLHRIKAPVCDGRALAQRPELVGKLIFLGPRDFGVNINPSSRVPLDQRSTARVQATQNVVDAETYLRSITPDSLYVSQLEHLTPDGHTMPIFDERGLILSEDRVHLTRAGARYVGERIFDDPVWAEVERTAYDRAARTGH